VTLGRDNVLRPWIVGEQPVRSRHHDKEENPMQSAWAAIAASTTLLGALAAPVAQAQTPTEAQLQARYLAANCANCHGTGGRSAGEMPSLAGMNRDQLITQMAAFKAGTRPATIMHQLAKGYTDAQIALIADYFAQQPRN
jgi:cytochrome subunit of sulfide dehydrogenase